MRYYKFTDTEFKAEELYPYKLIEKAEKKELSEEQKKRIVENTMSCVSQRGHWCQGGWAFDFRPYMKRYIVNRKGSWFPIYSFTRRMAIEVLHFQPDEIYEIRNRYK